MAKFKIRIVALLTTIAVFIMPFNSFAEQNLQNDCAKALVSLKIMQGYEDGSLRLQNKIKRSEFVTLIVKMLGYDKDTDVSNVKVDFKDIKKSHWAYNYARLAVKYKLVVGSPDKKFSPDNYITYSEALTVLIRSLGYESTLQGKWPENVLNKATEIDLNNNLNLPNNKQITRGDMSVMVYNSLTINLN
jgi:hypothetical protein